MLTRQGKSSALPSLFHTGLWSSKHLEVTVAVAPNPWIPVMYNRSLSPDSMRCALRRCLEAMPWTVKPSSRVMRKFSTESATIQ